MTNNGMPSAEFREVLRKTFGVKKPDRPKTPVALPLHDKPQKKEDRPRSVGNVALSAEAQRIYQPNLPAPQIKQPSAQQAGEGTAKAMTLNEAWGTPPQKE